MKRILFGFLLGAAVGGYATWYYGELQKKPSLSQARDAVVTGAGKVKDAIQETVNEIRVDEIKRELQNTSMVVREKARKTGESISDTASNARITTSIKTKLVAEPGLSAFDINVDTTGGLVTLTGTVESADQVAKAVKLALDTDGVHKVVSTLQVKPRG